MATLLRLLGFAEFLWLVVGILRICTLFIYVEIPTLNISDCSQSSISDKAFENLRGIHTLDLSFCDQTTITDAAFENLRGLHTLDMSHCYQSTITDKAFKNLRGIQRLGISRCDQSTITDTAFRKLARDTQSEYVVVPSGHYH